MLSRITSARALWLVAAMCPALPGVAQAQFAGAFAPGNWTTTDTAGGLVDASGAPGAILLTDGADDVGGYTSYTITLPYAAVLTFDWSYINNDLYQDPLFEPAGITLDGTYSDLIDELGDPAQSGTDTVSLQAGDVFGFEVQTFDGYYGGYNGSYGSAFLTLSDLAVPEPASLPVLAAGLCGLGLLTRRKTAAHAR